MRYQRKHARKFDVYTAEDAAARAGREFRRLIALLMTPFAIVMYAIHGFVIAGLFGAMTTHEMRELEERRRKAFEASPIGAIVRLGKILRGEVE